MIHAVPEAEAQNSGWVFAVVGWTAAARLGMCVLCAAMCLGTPADL